MLCSCNKVSDNPHGALDILSELSQVGVGVGDESLYLHIDLSLDMDCPRRGTLTTGSEAFFSQRHGTRERWAQLSAVSHQPFQQLGKLMLQSQMAQATVHTTLYFYFYFYLISFGNS